MTQVIIFLWPGATVFAMLRFVSGIGQSLPGGNAVVDRLNVDGKIAGITGRGNAMQNAKIKLFFARPLMWGAASIEAAGLFTASPPRRS
jgi:hypothetical protein